jgi:hypothetical protein
VPLLEGPLDGQPRRGAAEDEPARVDDDFLF